MDPKSLINHNNYALYAMYSSDFETAATEDETTSNRTRPISGPICLLRLRRL